MANPFTKGQRIEVTSKEGVVYGYVHKTVDSTVVMRLDSGDMTRPLDVRHVRPSSRAAPPNGPPREWKKWDRVEFAIEGTKYHGTIRSLGMTAKVVVDGGKSEADMPLGELSPSSKVLPAHEPTPMDDWSVGSYKVSAANSRETPAFSAKILLKGKPVIQASNDGNGGCNSYRRIAGTEAGIERRFEADAKAWFANFGLPNMYEPSDSFVDWYAQQRPYAVTGRDFVKELAARLGRDLSPAPSNAGEPARETVDEGRSLGM